MATRALGRAGLALVAAVSDGLQRASEQGSRVRVACSGGPDSLALAAAVAVCARRDPALLAEALVVDHQLQPGSREVAHAAVDAVRGLGLPARTVAVQVPHSGEGPEAAARRARYEALAAPDAAGGRRPDLVLLGHTLDDQAETVLLGLVRGSGTRSLAGMPARFGSAPQFWRPLLGVRRADTERACVEWGLAPWHDPQNRDDRFTRSRLRHRVLPVLTAELGEGFIEALARTATLAMQDADYLDALTSSALTRIMGDGGLDCARLADQPAALQGRLVRRWLATVGIVGLDFERTAAVLELVVAWRGQKGVDLPGGHRVVRRAGVLFLDH
ncbi:tRNA lysidine(34) synthetase TilS [Propionibacterium freudenreichii]|uniref:tRNA(Ile)-lysidine synthase n=3 Tax=Propionibacterium freudenreichii TaxID=1744 RepID=A0A2C7ZPJ0_9ACTN|nr:tRNA lysidine(34) synthetase TilS [Propionibacterium freudenreichii]CEP26559.1 TRNA(Ile)-lysidine synthetase [Propionibacterium freudenreichii subsp. freudenreichii]MCT2972900.1 tRNA lysidine(34) synthetase TilS [Propionibacterium freudenreichii]MCT2975532.1 tRNA lysidine(34) synthetase TilS [Propionibacterium freudenreichii]MCT2978709.1 tRNA lysidine(34) synthetase TilS [Propionibacterium freudenreichii]MCT2984153.1 tRNA lysidine(34) synthetase TilS [Propionibacterium freudenreichii]